MPPLNLIGDFGGGALYLALGVVAGLLETQKSGKGQVIDAAMVDGAASLMTAIYGMQAAGVWSDDARRRTSLDTGAHYYDVYETSDGQYVSIGSIEGQVLRRAAEAFRPEGQEIAAARWIARRGPS